MNYMKKAILAIIGFSCISNGLFAAGANVTNRLGAPIYFQLLTTNGLRHAFIYPDKTERVDAGALTGIDGARWLYCGKLYEVIFTAVGKTRIEGIEGWRDWDIYTDNINVGPSGILAGFGSLPAKVIVEGKCPCIINAP